MMGILLNAYNSKMHALLSPIAILCAIKISPQVRDKKTIALLMWAITFLFSFRKK
jgi:hypothetical protein